MNDLGSGEDERSSPLVEPITDRLSYLAGWNDAKAGRQYGEGRTVRDDPWLVPEEHRPTCPLTAGLPCTSWTCLVDVCADDGRRGI